VGRRAALQGMVSGRLQASGSATTPPRRSPCASSDSSSAPPQPSQITLLHPAAYATTLPGFSTQPRVGEHPPADSGKLITLRAGRHAGYDRVVFQLDGPIPYYSVRYVPQVRLDGSGDPLRLRGAAFLEVVIRAPTDDEHYRPVLTPTRLRPDFPALREVDAPGSFEGQTTAGIGVSYRAPSGSWSSPTPPGSSSTSRPSSASTTAASPVGRGRSP
jgi:hypothetical protein